MINNNQKTKGFTLIEMLVSILIFGFISVLLVNIFTSVLDTQTRILQNQGLLNQSSYALEYMSKAIRMAEKDSDGSCIGAENAGENYATGTDSISFLTYDTKTLTYKCLKFLLDNGAIEEIRSTDENPGTTAVPITSSSVSVDDLTFNVSGDGSAEDMNQPRITIMIKMKALPLAMYSPVLIVQTTISQRKLNI
ncbi:MAG TPA: type II secretion system protein [Candidatus Pacearchaeota archaeon]|nr:type II secretion system protein [Candidatus Pacearchaeota archaeon]HPR79681.1 type II secretion system protein [Candidatus Pacearchaeota archaeon]